MPWGYLTEFWNAVTGVVIDAGNYTADWFYSVGNAVAGAIGSLFDDLVHHFYDIFYIIQFLFDNLRTLFGILFTPLVWIFDFFKGFFISAFLAPPPPDITWNFTSDIMSIFNAIPYFSSFMFAIGTGITILFLVFVLKRLSLF